MAVKSRLLKRVFCSLLFAIFIVIEVHAMDEDGDDTCIQKSTYDPMNSLRNLDFTLIDEDLGKEISGEWTTMIFRDGRKTAKKSGVQNQFPKILHLLQKNKVLNSDTALFSLALAVEMQKSGKFDRGLYRALQTAIGHAAVKETPKAIKVILEDWNSGALMTIDDYERKNGNSALIFYHRLIENQFLSWEWKIVLYRMSRYKLYDFSTMSVVPFVEGSAEFNEDLRLVQLTIKYAQHFTRSSRERALKILEILLHQEDHWQRQIALMKALETMQKFSPWNWGLGERETKEQEALFETYALFLKEYFKHPSEASDEAKILFRRLLMSIPWHRDSEAWRGHYFHWSSLGLEFGIDSPNLNAFLSTIERADKIQFRYKSSTTGIYFEPHLESGSCLRSLFAVAFSLDDPWTTKFLEEFQYVLFPDRQPTSKAKVLDDPLDIDVVEKILNQLVNLSIHSKTDPVLQTPVIYQGNLAFLIAPNDDSKISKSFLGMHIQDSKIRFIYSPFTEEKGDAHYSYAKNRDESKIDRSFQFYTAYGVRKNTNNISLTNMRNFEYFLHEVGHWNTRKRREQNRVCDLATQNCIPYYFALFSEHDRSFLLHGIVINPKEPYAEFLAFDEVLFYKQNVLRSLIEYEAVVRENPVRSPLYWDPEVKLWNYVFMFYRIVNLAHVGFQNRRGGAVLAEIQKLLASIPEDTANEPPAKVSSVLRYVLARIDAALQFYGLLTPNPKVMALLYSEEELKASEDRLRDIVVKFRHKKPHDYRPQTRSLDLEQRLKRLNIQAEEKPTKAQ